MLLLSIPKHERSISMPKRKKCVYLYIYGHIKEDGIFTAIKSFLLRTGFFLSLYAQDTF